MSDALWRSTLEGAVAAHRGGRLDEAEAGYRAALGLRPDHADSLHLLGMLCHQRRRDAEAVPLLERAIAVDPATAEFHNTLGVCLGRLGRLNDARTALERALALKPDFAAALCNLGDTLLRAGQVGEAIACQRRAVALAPDNAEFHYNLGLALKESGDEAAAIAAYEHALVARPDYAEAHNNLGVALYDLGRLAEAGEHYARALALQPDNAQAHYNVGKLRQAECRLAEEAECYRRALALKPDFAAAHDNILMSMNYDATTTREALAAAHRAFGAAFDRPPAAIAPHANDRDPDRRLRVGYVSPDFRLHACAYFAAPLLTAHDRNRFEVYAYAENAKSDRMTERFRSLADHWRPTRNRSDEALAATIRADRIDILVDLAGHTADNRLPMFARKPAPVQVTWLGYPGTTGLRAIDYRITDGVADPPGSDSDATETLVRLPCGFLCYEPPADMPDVSPLPARATQCVTFGCFNNALKVNEAVVALWARVLQATPGSRLIVKAFNIERGGNEARLRRLFAAAGIDQDRLDIRGAYGASRSHFATYAEVDITLDPFPYNGTTTTCEALWLGVPTLTLAGDRHVARVGASLLSAVGLPELIAATPADYVAKAAALAGDLDRLAALRTGLRARMRASPLTDAAGFARAMEGAYRAMWRRWCAGAA